MLRVAKIAVVLKSNIWKANKSTPWPLQSSLTPALTGGFCGEIVTAGDFNLKILALFGGCPDCVYLALS